MIRVKNYISIGLARITQVWYFRNYDNKIQRYVTKSYVTKKFVTKKIVTNKFVTIKFVTKIIASLSVENHHKIKDNSVD